MTTPQENGPRTGSSDLAACYRERAEELYADGETDFEQHAIVTITPDGAWVSCRVWIGKDDLL